MDQPFLTADLRTDYTVTPNFGVYLAVINVGDAAIVTARAATGVAELRHSAHGAGRDDVQAVIGRQRPPLRSGGGGPEGWRGHAKPNAGLFIA